MLIGRAIKEEVAGWEEAFSLSRAPYSFCFSHGGFCFSYSDFFLFFPCPLFLFLSSFLAAVYPRGVLWVYLEDKPFEMHFIKHLESQPPPLSCFEPSLSDKLSLRKKEKNKV